MSKSTNRLKESAQLPRDDGNNSRKMEIIEGALDVFSEKGYAKTSVRDVAERCGILSGSLYHHFPSKDAIYLEAHGLALNRARIEIEAAAGRHADPWDKLKAACARHIQISVAPRSQPIAIMSELPRMEQPLRDKLIRQRDAFEALYKELVDALPLPDHIDRGVYRTLLVSTVNGVPAWYRPGRLSVDELSEQIMRIFSF